MCDAFVAVDGHVIVLDVDEARFLAVMVRVRYVFKVVSDYLLGKYFHYNRKMSNI